MRVDAGGDEEGEVEDPTHIVTVSLVDETPPKRAIRETGNCTVAKNKNLVGDEYIGSTFLRTLLVASPTWYEIRLSELTERFSHARVLVETF